MRRSAIDGSARALNPALRVSTNAIAPDRADSHKRQDEIASSHSSSFTHDHGIG